MIEMSWSTAKAAEVLGATTNTKDRIVTMTPWKNRIGIWTSLPLTFWKRFGRYPARPTSHMLRLGPAIQAMDAATAPRTSRPDRTLDKPGMPKPSAYTVKACEAPEVSFFFDDAATTE